MIVVSSGGVGSTNSITQAGNKPMSITMTGQQSPQQVGGATKTVTLATKPGQQNNATIINAKTGQQATTLLNTGSGQIIALPTQGLIQSGHQALTIGGKPVTVQVTTAGGQKTVTLVTTEAGSGVTSLSSTNATSTLASTNQSTAEVNSVSNANATDANSTSETTQKINFATTEPMEGVQDGITNKDSTEQTNLLNEENESDKSRKLLDETRENGTINQVGPDGVQVKEEPMETGEDAEKANKAKMAETGETTDPLSTLASAAIGSLTKSDQLNNATNGSNSPVVNGIKSELVSNLLI